MSYITPKVYRTKYQKAKKTHQCCTCNSIINPEDLYLYTFGIWKEMAAYKHCIYCAKTKEVSPEHYILNLWKLSNKSLANGEYSSRDLEDLIEVATILLVKHPITTGGINLLKIIEEYPIKGTLSKKLIKILGDLVIPKQELVNSCKKALIKKQLENL